jgi:hypothetical protein
MLPAPKKNEKLWPIRCPVIGVTGEIFSGKTLFCLGINPDDKTTVIYDEEMSSTTYADQRQDLVYVDIAAELAKKYPRGYKPREVWNWWVDDITKRAESGKFRVGVLDTVAMLEDGLVDDIQSNPNKHGLTVNQVRDSTGLIWGVMKSTWKSILLMVAGRLECLAFTVHMRAKYEAGKPTKKREPKGKTTLPELATLFLEMVRKPVPSDKGLILPRVPSARVIKDRLSVFTKDDYGSHIPVPVLPPYLPQATPAHIRWFMKNPVGLRDIDRDELIPPPEPMTEEDKLEVQRQTAELQARTAEATLSSIERQEKLEVARAAVRRQNLNPIDRAPVPQKSLPPPKAGPGPNGEHSLADIMPPVDESIPDASLTAEQKTSRLNWYFSRAIEKQVMTGQQVLASIHKRGVQNIYELSDRQLADLLPVMRKKLGIK